jgi:siroheme synthase
VAAAPRIAADLIAAGLDPSTPLAVVEKASLPTERTVFGTVASLPSLIEEQRVEGPAVILIGRVAALPQTECAALTAAIAG